MTREEMVRTAELWEADANRKDLATGYRAMARRQAKAWRANANNPMLCESYSESGTIEQFQDRMNQEVRL